MNNTLTLLEESSPGRHEVLLEGLQLAQLSEAMLLQLAVPGLYLHPSDYQQVQANSLKVGEGIFGSKLVGSYFPEVYIRQTAEGLLISSYDDAKNGKLTEQELLVLIAILKKITFRVFFDERLRDKLLREKAIDYGLEQEEELDQFFQLDYAAGELSIVSTVSSLMPVTEKSLEEWTKWIAPPRAMPVRSSNAETDQRIIVLKRHKYYHHLMIDLYHASSTKEGKVKNPLQAIHPLEEIWTMEGQQQVKFFAAIHKFQNPVANKELHIDVDALRAIVQNPLGYAFYYHDAGVSEKINASSIVPIIVNLLPKEIALSIAKQGVFYELHGTINIAGTAYAMNGLERWFDYFLLAEDTLYLVDEPKVLALLQLFRNKTANLLIHQNKYPLIKKQLLEKLEERIALKYAYVQTATAQQLAQFGATAEKLIYLSDFGNYVMITPVMRYGEAEVAIRTKRQIHGEDHDGEVFLIKRDDRLETDFMACLVRQHPYFEEQLTNELDYLYLHRKHFLDENWFLEVFETLFAQGVSVYGFNELEGNPYNPYKAKIAIRVLSGLNWFNVKAGVSYGKTKASLKKLHTAIRDKRKFVRLDDGSLGILPREWIEKFSTYFNIGELLDDDTIGIAKTNFSAIHELFDEEQLDESVKRDIREYERQLANFEAIKTVKESTGLKTVLRRYQQQGLSWLNFLDDFGFGGCLADDMGLGKSLQIIAFILTLRKKRGTGTHLLVVPTTLIPHWQQEVAKFAPSIEVLVHHAAGRRKNTKAFNDYDVVLTTYGTLVSDISLLKEFAFSYVFLDESQQIKNPESQRYKAARLLQAGNRVVITGTPLENNVFDLYGQLSFACPGLLGSKKYFKDVYLMPIDQFQDKKRLQMLQRKIRPFILRRTKKQVAEELPEKTEMILYCEMDPVQRKIYKAYEKEFREYISATTNEELDKSPMNVLRGLTRLRQICDSPILLGEGRLPGDSSAKIDTLMREIEGKAPDHKILVFSQFVTMLDLIKKALDDRHIAYAYLTGSTRNRGQVVDSFQSDPTTRVFLISLKAGGTGLNLTAADYVYLIDPWWNPAVENQAIDRAHRIGQAKHVVAARLVCTDTVEEKIMKLQEKKRALSEELIAGDQSSLNLSKEDLLRLLE